MRDSAADLDDVLLGGPLHEQEHTIIVERHANSDNRFNFDHEAFVMVMIRDFPLEHWVWPHIVHSIGPEANPHFLDLACITRMNYSAVITMLKAENVVDVPLTMN